jgi:acetyl-CoA carboxylase biotin carboxylase subunit
MRPIRKILIANRGEIALRIVRACRELGIATVAVYSDADRAALHVLHADEALRLGASPASESYLRTDLILAAAQQSGADAIHPGYGFLSENAAFAAACVEAGLRFIGPSAASMEILGSKTRARQLADRAGMPRTPGSTQPLDSLQQAAAVADEIGYPVMLKAAAGGGGKGMRVVQDAGELPSAFGSARSEAERAFGSDEVYLEKLIVRPRHIEIQIAADAHGNCVSLGERECSVQRRHQKVIEECPSAVVDAELRTRMGEAACRLALAGGYTNVGTVEFLLDADKKFYFLEMNTRLQVEHPVTELVTGIDLVQLQIRIAEGEPLPFSQGEIEQRGHAIECRIYAEDPGNNFFPSPGTITRLIQPSGPGIREDCGVYEGWTVPNDYDPLLSKLVAYAPTRALAIERLLRALDEYEVQGIRTNLGLFKRILADEEFRAAAIDTGWLERLMAADKHAVRGAEFADVAALASAFFEGYGEGSTPRSQMRDLGHPHPGPLPVSKWKDVSRREGLREPPGLRE